LSTWAGVERPCLHASARRRRAGTPKRQDVSDCVLYQLGTGGILYPFGHAIRLVSSRGWQQPVATSGLTAIHHSCRNRTGLPCFMFLLPLRHRKRVARDAISFSQRCIPPWCIISLSTPFALPSLAALLPLPGDGITVWASPYSPAEAAGCCCRSLGCMTGGEHVTADISFSVRWRLLSVARMNFCAAERCLYRRVHRSLFVG